MLKRSWLWLARDRVQLSTLKESLTLTRVVNRGGNLNNGGNAGPFYVNVNNAFSNAGWNCGSRLETVDFQAAESLPMA